MENEMKTILVSYHAIKGSTNLIGNVDCLVNYFPPTIEDIRRIEKQISKENQFDNTVLMNIILLG